MNSSPIIPCWRSCSKVWVACRVGNVCPDDSAPQTEPEALTKLPPRERDVLRLIGQGCTNREIATQLNLAEGTVKTYVTHLLNRLALSNRSQLAIYANSIASFLNP
jgi:DNA-binding NarL/FixJ family response regulator